jgi:hypothetical protein
MRRAIILATIAIVLMALHAVLLRLAAHGHVAHVLLGAGNGMPPLGAALLAVALVLARVGAIVLAPGLFLAAAAEAIAFVVAGPRHSRSGAGISVADGAGTSIGIRGTE